MISAMIVNVICSESSSSCFLGGELKLWDERRLLVRDGNLVEKLRDGRGLVSTTFR